MRTYAHFIFKVLTQMYIPNVQNVPRLDMPGTSDLMRPFTHFILRVPTEIYIPHVPNLPDISILVTPYQFIYMRSNAHYIFRVLTQTYIPLVPNIRIVQKLNTPSPSILMHPLANYTYSILTEIYIPHLSNVPNLEIRQKMPIRLYAPTRPLNIQSGHTDIHIPRLKLPESPEGRHALSTRFE